MHAPEEPTAKRFRGSRVAVRTGSAILALFVLAYATLISIARIRDLESPTDYVILGSLWLLAMAALWLLARAWRAASKSPSH
jgi:protein-S-isoprenylcysteine O-methyltransferase Ste14